MSDGTARLGLDYAGNPTGTATITKGLLFTTVSIPILAEPFVEGNRSFTLTLSKSVGAGIQKAVATGTIMESQLTPTLTLSDAIVKKGPSGQQQATFTVFANYPIASAASPSGLATTMTITPSDLTATGAEGDFVTAPITVTLPAGASSMTFNIPINGDTIPEGNETFRATISNPSNGDLVSARLAGQDTGAVGEGLATIVDFNSVPALNIGDIVVPEAQGGQQTYNVPILLTSPSTLPITVQVDTTDGATTTALAAVANKDYIPIVGATFTIPAGATSFNIPVTVFGHSFFAGDKSFTLSLSNPQNATVNKDQATVTIVDGNSLLGATQFLVKIKPQSAVGTYTYTVQPLVSDRIRLAYFQGGPSLSISNETVQDNASQVNFTVTLSQAASQPVTVLVSTNDGTAHAGTDYTAISNQLVTFAPGQTTQQVSVSLIPGTTPKPLGTFTLSASSLTVEGTLAPPSYIQNAGTASIVDVNDNSNTFWSVGDVTASDGNAALGTTTPLTFTIFTNQAFATPQTILVDTSGSIGDYIPLVNNANLQSIVTLPAGATSVTFNVNVFTGLTLPANVIFHVTLSAPSSGVLGQKTVGTGTILNNNTFDATVLARADQLAGRRARVHYRGQPARRPEKRAHRHGFGNDRRAVRHHLHHLHQRH